MKKIIVLLLLSLESIVSGENFKLIGKYKVNPYSTINRFYIDEDTITYSFEIPLAEKKIIYEKVYRDGLLFFELSEPFPKEFSEQFYYEKEEIKTNNTLLVLAGKRMDSKEILLFGTTAGFYGGKTLLIPSHFEWSNNYIDCSSFLVEKNKQYTIDNLSLYEVNTPWVESKSGDGIGEWFIIDNKFVYKYLLIMNGYISFEKPYLYKQNNRVKKIKVTGMNSRKEKSIEVLDTPHPQTVDISFLTEVENIKVTIEDVYKGTKYDDTCLHYCTTFYEEVVPYEDSIGE